MLNKVDSSIVPGLKGLPAGQWIKLDIFSGGICIKHDDVVLVLYCNNGCVGVSILFMFDDNFCYYSDKVFTEESAFIVVDSLCSQFNIPVITSENAKWFIKKVTDSCTNVSKLKN